MVISRFQEALAQACIVANAFAAASTTTVKAGIQIDIDAAAAIPANHLVLVLAASKTTQQL